MVATSFPQSTVDLLSKIAGQPLQPKQVTPRTLFIAALTTAMMGATYADGQVSDEEKQKLQQIFNQFFPTQSKMGQLVRVLGKGIQQHKIHLDPKHLSSLTYGLSESERLLILAFACEIAAADGSVAQEEIQYLQSLAQYIEVESQYLDNFVSIVQSKSIDSSTAVEIHNLLDPHRFQDLDPIFVHVADYMVSKLPSLHAHHNKQADSVINYEQLEKFSLYQRQLCNASFELSQIVQVCEAKLAHAPTRPENIAQLSEKIQSQRFRIAVVGEFSQGKSTLLNALLGEDIQPVRAIPCSGAITVLRYGEKLRVICRHKEGWEEEIPFEQYQEKASISEQAALCGLSDELAQSTVHEIILEHPSLELCQHNVEIIDSPGLNEHPERTAITQRLLQDTDAAIFLVNASRPLTQGERLLLHDLRTQLNQGNSDKPADNLFVLVNFMDLLRREADRQQVQRLVENFVYGENPIVSQRNRLHFISAQAALDAIIDGENNEFLDNFKGFTSALEYFLAQERGAIVVEQAATLLHHMIQESEESLHQSIDVMDGNVRVSEEDQRKIINQIGEASGRHLKIQEQFQTLREGAISEVAASWRQWKENTAWKIQQKSSAWTSEHQQKDKILKDYSEQFIRDISTDLDEWMNKSVKTQILQPKIESLDKLIAEELTAIRVNLEALDSSTGANLTKQFNLSLHLNSSGVEEGGFFSFAGFGGGGVLTGIALATLGFGFLPILLIGGVAGAVIGLMFGSNLEETCRKEVVEKGLQHLNTKSNDIFIKIRDSVELTFQDRQESVDDAIEHSISLLNFLLESQEKVYQESLDAHETNKAFIQGQLKNLSRLNQDLQALTSKVLV